MTANLTIVLTDAEAVLDLDTFIGRAEQIENQSVRLVADGDVLAAWVQVLSPRGLSDTTPTVLGMRGFSLAVPSTFDVVVPAESMRARLTAARPIDAGSEVTLPATAPSVRWTVALPSRDGWETTGKVASVDLEQVANDGIREVTKGVPTEAEERVVRSVRSQVWGSNISSAIGIPAGVAFAVVTLGFLGDDTMSVAVRDPWVRVSGQRGVVVAKRTPVVLDDDPLH
jgi:hypothetical protein